MTFANLVAADGGNPAAWNPWLAALAALVVATPVGLGFGAIAARSEGIYFLMITLAFSVLVFYFFSPGHAALGLRRRQQPRPAGRWSATPSLDPLPLFYTTLVVSVVVFVALKYVSRTPFGLALQGLRDEPARMRALGFDVTRHRMLAFTLAAFVAGIAGLLVGLVQPPHLAGVDQPRADDRHPDHRGGRRAVPARGRLGRGARLRADRQLLARVGPRRRATCWDRRGSTRSSASSS